MEITITEDDTDGLIVRINGDGERPSSVDVSAVTAQEETETESTTTESVEPPQRQGQDGGEAPSLLVFGEPSSTGESTAGVDTELSVPHQERPDEGLFSGGEYGQPQLDQPGEQSQTQGHRGGDAFSGGEYSQLQADRTSTNGGEESASTIDAGGMSSSRPQRQSQPRSEDRSRSSSQSGQSIDPSRYTVDELKEVLDDVSDRDRLDAILEAERREQDRRTAKDAIRRRMESSP